MSLMKLAVFLCAVMLEPGLFTTKVHSMAQAHRHSRRELLHTGTCYTEDDDDEEHMGLNSLQASPYKDALLLL